MSIIVEIECNTVFIFVLKSSMREPGRYSSEIATFYISKALNSNSRAEKTSTGNGDLG